MDKKADLVVARADKPAGRKALSAFCFVFLIVLFVPGCANSIKPQSSTHFIMDTIVQLDVYGQDQAKTAAAMQKALTVMQQVADEADRYHDSELTDVNKAAGIRPVKVSADLLAMALFVQTQKNAQVDLTIGTLVDLWKLSEQEKLVPSQAQVQAALAVTSMEKLLIDTNEGTLYLQDQAMSLDFGAVAKGYAVERAGRVLAEEKDVVCALVNGGGNIKVVGSKPDGKPWLIGIQDPREQNANIGVLKLQAGEAVATSGDYQRYYEVNGERYHHLLSTQTGFPANYNISATAVSQDAFLADYYSTLLFLLPTQQAQVFVEQTPGLHAIIIGEDENVYVSSGLRDRFEKNEQTGWTFEQK